MAARWDNVDSITLRQTYMYLMWNFIIKPATFQLSSTRLPSELNGSHSELNLFRKMSEVEVFENNPSTSCLEKRHSWALGQRKPYQSTRFLQLTNKWQHDGIMWIALRFVKHILKIKLLTETKPIEIRRSEVRIPVLVQVFLLRYYNVKHILCGFS